MSINRNFYTRMFMLQLKGEPTRNEYGEIIETWEDLINIPVQVQEIKRVRYSNNVRHTETSLIGVVRGFEFKDGIYRLKSEEGLYKVLDGKKIGARFVMELEQIEGV